jgi:hypothetical protein
MGWEVGADVAESSGSEQCIDHCVDHGIGVRVTGETVVVRDGNATQHEGTPLDEGMNIVAKTNA